MQFEPLSDEYVQQLAASQEEVCRHFVRYFGSLIAMKLRSRMLPPHVIDEIRQETFTRVLVTVRKPGSLRDGRKLGAFVNSTCNHVLSEYFRKGSRLTPLDSEHVQVPSGSSGAEEDILAQETRKQVHAILAKLPERDRRILTAVFLEELDKDMVCEEFGVDRGYLRVLLHRAKVSFRERFET